VRVGAERSPAVGNDLRVGRKLCEALLELLQRDRARTRDVARVELLGWTDVDEDHITAIHPLDQLGPADRLHLGPEVLARRPLRLGETRDGDVAQREPQGEHLVACERVANAGPLACSAHHPGGV
jgi:hypothetical protein